ncbi:nonstructural protein 1 [Influenza A virus (A/little yellow-shouldered bat/Guatemala/060/2010(H17N10))]|uniref:Non-structural protein 1 n=1 Tax=Influenza A virus (A/little yellow-shouldered bat/Guatemala/060/2010(H17N10)) TaxID=1129347 RepID=H6QM99_9INFA|nr:nonstructural protein 1 [Influenza A virus (A/little yellow-shouldered bat/Guatemala/060/2010(H17N10))]
MEPNPTTIAFQVDCYLWHLKKTLSMMGEVDAPFEDRLRREQKALKGRSMTLGIDIQSATQEGYYKIKSITEESMPSYGILPNAGQNEPKYITEMTQEETTRNWVMIQPKQKIISGRILISMDQAVTNKVLTIKANFTVCFGKLERLVLARAFTEEGTVVGEINPLSFVTGHTGEDVKAAYELFRSGFEWNDNTIDESQILQRLARGVINENRRLPQDGPTE